jgi:hypothetical protein
MFILGSSFDEDPLLPWAKQALSESEGEHEDARIDRLNALVWDHVEGIRPELVRVDGEGSVFIEEIRALREEPNELLTPLSMAPLPQRAFDWLARLFPSKCRRAGEGCVRLSIDRGIERATELGLGTPRGALMLVAMRFVLGSGCTEDPLLPWLPPILRDPAVFSTSERVDRVFSATLNCLSRWWK